MEVFVSISKLRCNEGTYTLLNPSAPLIWNFIRSVSTILATERIYSDHNHGCLHSSSSQHRPGTQGTVQEYKWAGTAHPDAAFVVTGDFNKANFRTIAPKYFQHITINTRGDRTLNHCYSPFRDAYKSLPCPPFGRSDHSSVLLLPAYRQKLKREAPALRTVQCWSDQSDAILQDCFDHVDWDMFRAASDDDIEAYSDTVTCFIRKCIDDVVPTKQSVSTPTKYRGLTAMFDQPCQRGHLPLNPKTLTIGNKPVTISGDPSKQPNEHIKTELKNISTTITQEACGRALTTSQTLKGVNQLLWTLPPLYRTSSTPFMLGSRLITPHTESAAAAAAEEVSPLTLSVADVTRSFKRVNIRKAVGPDGIPGRVLKACAFQLAGVFTDIFNLSLSVCGSLMLQKINHCAHTKEK